MSVLGQCIYRSSNLFVKYKIKKSPDINLLHAVEIFLLMGGKDNKILQLEGFIKIERKKTARGAEIILLYCKKLRPKKI